MLYIYRTKYALLTDKAWTTVNMLKFNKTEVMLIISKRTKHLHNLHTSITIGNDHFPLKQSVKNFSFTIDYHLTMNEHVPIIPQTCLNYPSNISPLFLKHATLNHVV